MRTTCRRRFLLLCCLSCFLLVPTALGAETLRHFEKVTGSGPSRGVLELLPPEEIEKVSAGGLFRPVAGAEMDVKECTAGVILWDEDGLSRSIRSLSLREAIRN